MSKKPPKDDAAEKPAGKSYRGKKSLYADMQPEQLVELANLVIKRANRIKLISVDATTLKLVPVEGVPTAPFKDAMRALRKIVAKLEDRIGDRTNLLADEEAARRILQWDGK